MVWIRFINNKGDGKHFLLVKIENAKYTADESAWAGRGRKREYALDKLKNP